MELVLKLQNYGLRRSKGRIVYDSDSICYTGVPETLKRLFRQRDHWQRGPLDCLFKYSNMLFSPMFDLLGMLVLPWQLIFELLGPLWSLSYFMCPVFRDMFPKSWLIYFVYICFEFFITVYEALINVNRNMFKLLILIPEILVFTFMETLIQVPVSIPRLWGVISFPSRRIVW